MYDSYIENQQGRAKNMMALKLSVMRHQSIHEEHSYNLVSTNMKGLHVHVSFKNKTLKNNIKLYKNVPIVHQGAVSYKKNNH